MKKKLLIILAIVAALAICIFAWFYGYEHRKSNDNLPALTTIAQMDEAELNKILPGYRIHQLIEVWGDPDFSQGNTGRWEIGNKSLIVSFNNDLVADCRLEDGNTP